jgi:hypothetical protein
MKHIVEYSLPDGAPVLIEIEDAGSTQRIGRGQEIAERAEQSFIDAISRIRPAAEIIVEAFRKLNTPAEMDLEFGIKFNAKAGAFIASVDSEATFKVMLKWKNMT